MQLCQDRIKQNLKVRLDQLVEHPFNSSISDQAKGFIDGLAMAGAITFKEERDARNRMIEIWRRAAAESRNSRAV